MTQYIKITLSPGHQKRSDISDWALSTGELIWIGADEDTFDDTAVIGPIGPTDPVPPDKYTYVVCTQDDINELAALSFAIRKNNRIQLIQEGLIDCIQGIVKLYQVGASKGIWAIGDFPVALVQSFQDWIALINEHENDTQQPPTE